MTAAQDAREAADYQPTSYYWHAREGQPQEHCLGNSCENLVGMDCPRQEPTPPAAPHLHQPACTVPKPVRSEAAPPSASTATAAGSLGSSPRGGAASSCLDQYHSMLPDNPVQQLPLLPTTASHTSATVRVAAWLLGGGDAAGDTQQEAAAAEEDAAGCTASSDAASLAGCSDVALLDELEQARYGPGGDTRASAAQAPAQHLGKAGSDVDGYRATSYYCQASRRSLDGFMSRPVQHSDVLNNYVAAMY
ncbi:expressed protein [Chlorella variabilis]|uniref:Expressed protein n=1 Tax=Chlorella variabilis TaxID=554065 RepID=E1Z799_CHLVA|nr:expressed protein [Chlorella variabilis]EFN57880.1 expressed protein [Chlorella variabilis]|eukprot:XP_005849982.1 expressed protein [Chlorella variabilis]